MAHLNLSHDIKNDRWHKTLNQGELVEQGIFRIDIESKIPIRVVHVLPNRFCPNHPVKSTHGIVEFYDKRRYEYTPDGKFITRYRVATLYESNFGTTGLNLNCGIPDWEVDPNSMKKILNWLRYNDLKIHNQKYFC